MTLFKTNQYQAVCIFNLLFIGCFLLATDSMAKVTTQQITAQRKIQLTALLLDDCGSCHGRTLMGGLGPALLAKNLQGKPDELLFETIKNGRLKTPMPPWKNFLNDSEIEWLIGQLRTEIWQQKLSSIQVLSQQLMRTNTGKENVK